MTTYLLLNGKNADLIETADVLSEVSTVFNTTAQAVTENLTLAHPFLLWFNEQTQNPAYGKVNAGASAILKAFTGFDDNSLNIHAPVAVTGLFIEGTQYLSSVEARAIRVLRGKFGIRIDLESRPRRSRAA